MAGDKTRPYRVGNHSPINIWRETGQGREANEQIAVAMTPAWAALIVKALNADHRVSDSEGHQDTVAAVVDDADLQAELVTTLDGMPSEFIHPNEFGGFDVDNRAFAEIAHSVYGPALRKAYLAGHDAGYAAANAGDPWAEQQPAPPVADTEPVPPGAWVDIVGAVGYDESSECLPQFVAAVEEAARQAVDQYKRSVRPVVDTDLRDRIAAERDRLGHLAKDLAATIDQLKERMATRERVHETFKQEKNDVIQRLCDELDKARDRILKADIAVATARGELPCPHGASSCTTVDGHWYHADCARSGVSGVGSQPDSEPDNEAIELTESLRRRSISSTTPAEPRGGES